jgi:hypothetical protein
MLEFFKNIFAFLNAEGVKYMLSGSVAMSIHIVPRATHDMDVVIELLPEHLDKFVDHFGKKYYCD